MADTVIIAGKQLPTVTRRPDGSVQLQRGHRGLVIPADLADDSLDAETHRHLRAIIVDGSRGAADLLAGLLLLHELGAAGKTLGQAADNQGALRRMMEAATYSVVRSLP